MAFNLDGVSLSLKGAAIANDGYVDVDDIGESDTDALLCHTNKPGCCGTHPNREGEWYSSNMSPVGTMASHIEAGHTSYFSRNRGDSVVRLLRVGTPIERGRFYCEVQDASGVNQTIYVNIGKCVIV